MADCREQHAAVKFCFLLGKSAAETIVMLKTAYEDAALSKTRVYEWFSRFKNGEMSIEDQPRSRRPARLRSDENVDKINALIREDRRRTIDQLCEMSGISWSSIQRINSEDLHMGRVAAKFVPRLLTGEQRERRLQACFELQNQLEENPFFPRWLLVMNRGVMDTTPKQSSNQASGSHLALLVPKKPAKWSRTSRQCSFVSSIAKVLCTRSSYPRVKLLTRSCTWRFWKD